MCKKIVIFDLDDTLILEKDYVKSGFNAVALEISKKFKKPYDLIIELLNKLFEENSKNVFNRLLENLEISFSEKEIQDLVAIYRNHEPNIKLCEEAEIILDYLFNKGYKMGIITDGYKEVQKKKIKALNINRYFDHIIITDELGKEYWKPSEVPYKIMQKKFNVKFEDMIYIGDNPKKDFITANKLGISTIHLKKDNRIYSKVLVSDEYVAQKEINSLLEIIELLKI
jgi:putative hydrolase of the HAD superfamily